MRGGHACPCASGAAIVEGTSAISATTPVPIILHLLESLLRPLEAFCAIILQRSLEHLRPCPVAGLHSPRAPSGPLTRLTVVAGSRRSLLLVPAPFACL